MIECQQCGLLFTPRTKNQKYCDPNCTRIATNLKLTAQYYYKRERLKGVPRECLDCKVSLSRYNPEPYCYNCSRSRKQRALDNKTENMVKDATKKYGKEK